VEHAGRSAALLIHRRNDQRTRWEVHEGIGGGKKKFSTQGKGSGAARTDVELFLESGSDSVPIGAGERARDYHEGSDSGEGMKSEGKATKKPGSLFSAKRGELNGVCNRRRKA